MKKIFNFILITLIISACNNDKSNKEMPGSVAKLSSEDVAISTSEINEPPNPDELASDPEVINPAILKKIIKDGKLGLQVNNLEKAKKYVDSLVNTSGSYYANESLNNSKYETAYYLRIRIPSVNFESFISKIESGESKILYKEVDARDVSEEFIDLETRLENKRSYLTRYRELVKQAKTIKQILEIEEKIRVIEEEIESTEGRLRYLTSQVSFSTLNLTISQERNFKYKPTKRDRFSEKLKQSVTEGWFGFITFFLVILRIWPFIILIITGVFVWKRFRKKTNK